MPYNNNLSFLRAPPTFFTFQKIPSVSWAYTVFATLNTFQLQNFLVDLIPNLRCNHLEESPHRRQKFLEISQLMGEISQLQI